MRVRHLEGVPPEPAQPFTAQTPEQARLLLDFQYQRVLGATMQGELTASEVAADAEIPLKQAHHRLTRLLEAGLIHIVAERKRSGRAVKVYRAVAQAYSVPFDLTEADDSQTLLHVMFQPILGAYLKQIAEFHRHRAKELLLSINQQGQVSMNFGGLKPNNEPARAFGIMGEHTLRSATALELERRLRELQRWILEREAEEKDQPGAQTYITGLMLAAGRVED